MKEVTVKTASGQAQVLLNNAENGDKLTAAMARQARELAAGVGANATVSDGKTTFRVTRRRTLRRKQ